MNPFGTEFWKFPRKRSFCQKSKKKWNFFQRLATSGRHNSAMITDRWKFITEITLYGIFGFHFTVGINSKSFPWPGSLTGQNLDIRVINETDLCERGSALAVVTVSWNESCWCGQCSSELSRVNHDVDDWSLAVIWYLYSTCPVLMSRCVKRTASSPLLARTASPQRHNIIIRPHRSRPTTWMRPIVKPWFHVNTNLF